MKKMRSVFSCILLLFLVSAYGQPKYYNQVLKKLTSKNLSGRGYTYNGMEKASDYLAKEFNKNGLKSFNGSYLQEFEFPINIIHQTKLTINGKKLVYGKDYIVKPGSKSISTAENINYYHFPIDDYIKSFESKEKIKQFIINDTQHQKDKHVILPVLHTTVDSINTYYKQWANIYESDNNKYRAIFRFTKDSLLSSLSQRQAGVSEFIIKEKYYYKNLKINEYEIKSEFNPKFKFNNVVGYIDGINNDSVVVITGHYDHLGRVNKSIFPGASDNASGTAMVLELAKHYSKNKPKYRTVFMLFGAEEAGIVGSFKYVDSPLFPLNEIKFLVNLDIMGAGEEGIQVVNGSKFKKEFDDLVRINSENKYLKQVKIRGESCNSDHCPFDKKGVPSFFIYTLGGKGNYHNIYDSYENLDLSYAEKVRDLLIRFVDGI
ncbi:M28 family metallopeptidase [Faecalibacter bovis]|uniref:Zn-dependent exopeptidase M28 n=1 Tax=Faecalibacter bovis TaxID=2898187 RepID=A0ABX7XDM3_9FLAO|nr:M28 family peptidase [Faecalibacter bovis]QTV05867.1 Zn-dependent exopeptidase M28 [Faecalibacter bovis]